MVYTIYDPNLTSTIWVNSTTGTNDRTSKNKYDQKAPFLTIEAAVTTSAVGDCIRVQKGVYNVASVITLIDRYLVLEDGVEVNAPTTGDLFIINNSTINTGIYGPNSLIKGTATLISTNTSLIRISNGYCVLGNVVANNNSTAGEVVLILSSSIFGSKLELETLTAFPVVGTNNITALNINAACEINFKKIIAAVGGKNFATGVNYTNATANSRFVINGDILESSFQIQTLTSAGHDIIVDIDTISSTASFPGTGTGNINFNCNKLTNIQLGNTGLSGTFNVKNITNQANLNYNGTGLSRQVFEFNNCNQLILVRVPTGSQNLLFFKNSIFNFVNLTGNNNNSEIGVTFENCSFVSSGAAAINGSVTVAVTTSVTHNLIFDNCKFINYNGNFITYTNSSPSLTVVSGSIIFRNCTAIPNTTTNAISASVFNVGSVAFTSLPQIIMHGRNITSHTVDTILPVYNPIGKWHLNMGLNEVVNFVAENGQVNFGTAESSTTNTYADIAASNFTLPSAGDWEVQYYIPTFQIGGPAEGRVKIVTSANVDVPNSTMTNGGGSVFTGNESSGVLSKSVFITTTGPASYKMQFARAAGGGTFRINDGSNGFSTIKYKKISGSIPVTGQIVQFGESIVPSNVTVPATSTNAANATDIISFTLPAAGTYEIDYICRMGSSVMSSSQSTGGVFIITDNSNTLIPGSEIKAIRNVTGSTSGTGSDFQGTGVGSIRITTTGSATYKLRSHHDGSSAGLGYTVQSDGNGRTKVTWKQLGNSATTQFLGATGTAAGAAGYVPAPLATDNINFLRGDGTWAAITGASLSKTLTYGAALNARQPVYMQTDGRVYPMVGSGGTLTGGALTTTYFGASVESYAVDAHPTIANRFMTMVPYSDGSIYQNYHDVNPTTGAITMTTVTPISGQPTANTTEGIGYAINNAGTKGLVAYGQGGANLQLANLNMTTTGATSVLGSVGIASSSANSPYILPTSNGNKFLMSRRGSSTFDILVVDCTAATPTSTTLTSLTLGASSVKSGFIVPLNTVDTYAYVNMSGPSTTIQAFSFNTTTNAVNLIGTGAIIAGFTGALNFDVIYSDSTETWIALQRDGAPTSVTMVKILQATGAVTSFSPTTFTTDTIANALSVGIYGYKKSLGKFLISWNANTNPNQVKYGEWTLDRATGAITVSLATINGVTTATGWNQGRTFHTNAIGLNYAYRIFSQNTASGLVSSTFGTYTTAANAFQLIGINRTAGAINTTGIVDLISSIATGFTGLTPSSVYYADLATGGVTTTATSGIIVGRAISATEIQIHK